MKCANSFWVNLINNNKRRIWVWVISVLSMLCVYPGVLMVYFSRLDSYRRLGYYLSDLDFYKECGQTVIACISSRPGILTVGIAVIIALQGFSYLFSKRKVDMYHSVPVSMKKRFFAIYLNGIFIYTISLLVGNLFLVIMSIAKGAQLAYLYPRILLMMLMCFVLFLAVYNISVFVIMLVGNYYMAGILVVLTLGYINLITEIFSGYRSSYFKTYSWAYQQKKIGVSIFDLYNYATEKLLNTYSIPKTFIRPLLIGVLFEAVWIVIMLLLAYSNYKKRPSEAAGRSLVFYSSRIIIKLMVMVPAALQFALWMRSFSEQSPALTVAALVISAVFSGMIIEIVFNLEFKSAIRNWGSIVFGLLIVAVCFAFFRFDLLKYDKFVPTADELESFAVVNESGAYYTDCFNPNSNQDDYNETYINSYTYAMDNMFLTDKEAIIRLANKSVEKGYSGDDNMLPLAVHYRLTSGKEKNRTIWVDLNDETNNEYLNRIIGPAYYKEGIWQAMNTDIPGNIKILSASFCTSLSDFQINATDVDDIIRLWREDMSKYDYNLVRYDVEKGYISISFSNGLTWNLPVYECFEGVTLYMEKECEVTALDITADDIESMTIYSYNNDSIDSIGQAVEREYTDRSEIATLFEAMTINPMHSEWYPSDKISWDYSVEINLTENCVKTYNLSSLCYSYVIMSDEVDYLNSMGLLP